MEYPLPTKTEIDRLQEETRAMAAVNLHLGVKALGVRVIDPSLTTKSLLELNEHFYKVSGLAAKQEKQADTGRFVFNIHFGGQPVTISSEKVVEGEPVDEVVEAAGESAALLGEAPAYLLAGSGNLAGLLDD